MTVCSYHVTYAFQSESTLYSLLNVKELLARVPLHSHSYNSYMLSAYYSLMKMLVPVKLQWVSPARMMS